MRRALGAGPLASRLSPAQVDLLVSLGVESQHDAGELVLREGQTSDRLFLIAEGRIEVEKLDEQSGRAFRIGELGPGDLFGDMSFLDGQPASATIRAAEPTRLLSIRREAFEGGDHARRDAFEAVLRAVAALNVTRLRTQNEAHVASLRAELDSSRIKNEAAQFLILIVIVFGIQNFTGVLIRALSVDTNNPLYEYGMLLVFLLPSLYFARRFGYTWEQMGVTTRNWKRSLLESAWIAPLLVVGLASTVALLRRNGALPADAPLFSGRLLHERPWEPVAYLAHAGLQELGSRGIFQGSLQRFLGAGQGLRAVLVTSLMFGILHLHLGMTMAVMAFVGSSFFGYLYLRHGTLLGVTLLHYLVGMLLELGGLM